MIYLASPYTHPDASVREERARKASLAAASLMREGLIIFSPIAHGHAIASVSPIPTDWAYWQNHCAEFISISSGMIVLKLEGWESSTGVQNEIQIARNLGLPIEFMEEDEI